MSSPPEALRPSTLASRRAARGEAPDRPGRRLASMGTRSEFVEKARPRNLQHWKPAPVVRKEYELLVDLKDAHTVYRLWEDGTHETVYRGVQREPDSVTPLGPVSRRAGLNDHGTPTPDVVTPVATLDALTESW